MKRSGSLLQDRILASNDPMKSSILRDSTHGWSSPPPQTATPNSTTIPLRIAKRSPLPAAHSGSASHLPTAVARRSSNSYKHMRNNNLVSRSPFKSQIPALPTTSSARMTRSQTKAMASNAISFPSSPRKVSGEKRPRPQSIHDQAESENDRPFAYKRDRKQSKGFQGLIEKEPVTRSPFRQQTAFASSHDPVSPTPGGGGGLTSPTPRRNAHHSTDPIPTTSDSPHSSPPPVPAKDTKPIPIPVVTPRPPSRESPSPVRSSLVSKRLHGPRTSGAGAGGGGGRRMGRKKVIFDERCDVIEFETEEGDEDEELFESEDERLDILEGDDDESLTAQLHSMLHSSTGPSDVLAHAQSLLSTPPGRPSTPTIGGGNVGSPGAQLRSAYTQRQGDVGMASPSPMKKTMGSIMEGGSIVDDEEDEDDEEVEIRPRFGVSLEKARMISPPRSASRNDPFMDDDEQSFTSESTQPQDQSHDPETSVGHSEISLGEMQATVGLGIDMDMDFGGEIEFQLDGEKKERDECMTDGGSESVESWEGGSDRPEVTSTPTHGASPSKRGTSTPTRGTPTRVTSPPVGGSSPALRHSSPVTRLSSPSALRVSSPSNPALGRVTSPSARVGSPLVDASSVGNVGAGSSSGRPRISREAVQRRMKRTRSEELEDNEDGNEKVLNRMSTLTDVSTETAEVYTAEKRTVPPQRISGISMRREDNPTYDGIMSIDPDPQAIDPPRPSLPHRAHTTDFSVSPALDFDFGSKFGKGHMSFDTDEGISMVDMDMKSALDRLMDDVAGAGSSTAGTRTQRPLRTPDDSMATEGSSMYHEAGSPDSGHPVASMERTTAERPIERAATDSALMPGNGLSRTASGSTIPPPIPQKDARRKREEMIIEKRRLMRRLDEEESMGFVTPPRLGVKIGDEGRSGKPPQQQQGGARLSRRRSRSTGDVRDGKSLLSKALGAESGELGDSIDRELRKMEGTRSKYHVREREETIYASSSGDNNRHESARDTVETVGNAGDVNGGKAWRTVRRPSDMNEYSKQIKEYRAQAKPGKAHGKVFVKVLAMKSATLPIPQQATALTCTLNNGIHFVTTPECKLGADCKIEQEFELIEHSKLEFTLTLKIRRDPHIISQFKSNALPIPAAPVPASKGGMRSFFSSPKKSKDKDKGAVRPLSQLPLPQLPENLARYLKPDGTLARAFISFKDVVSRCDTRLFETSYPLIGQKTLVGNNGAITATTTQVGELVLQMFRLPPLPGISPSKLPQSLEECHRGLRHINWHKVTYFEGVLTQNGGDCTTWRRRQLRVIGSNLVAFNDVTKKATATIDLKKATAVEDDQMRKLAATDDYEGLYGVERSFRLIFPQQQEITFFADTDEEKAKWLEVFRALVGHIPPNPLWAELIWQRNEELARNPPLSAQQTSSSQHTYGPPS